VAACWDLGVFPRLRSTGLIGSLGIAPGIGATLGGHRGELRHARNQPKRALEGAPPSDTVERPSRGKPSLRHMEPEHLISPVP
jgi:hypothetical protein